MIRLYMLIFSSFLPTVAIIATCTGCAGGSSIPRAPGLDQIGVRKMNWRHYVILFVIGLLSLCGLALLKLCLVIWMPTIILRAACNLRMAKVLLSLIFGIIWMIRKNLPHPSHTYWMPLASIVSAIGMWITGQSTYAAGRLPFILLSACVPLLTATLAFDVTRKTLSRWSLVCYPSSRFIMLLSCPFQITMLFTCCLAERFCCWLRATKNGFLLRSARWLV